MNGSKGAVVGASILFVALHAVGAELNTQIENYRSSHEAAIVGELDQLIRLKSVAADAAGITAANRLQKSLQDRGFAAQQWSATA